ncbi:type IV secretion protein Rhs [Chryseobacterium indologenes]|uniref:Type IV secretion protein Rhs n=1 Tax=Chryseobacterium indologenes TaxID=253 RepID=A0AAD0YXB3_CHRID|nr:RHS repeat-associated core domain-containing protein [Chryseobacterium indologenes]AZB18817.1 type IV secretion protein Rhs [Chryseobacterium indologenes]
MKLILSFILSLFSVYAFSQTILYQAESTSRTVQDPQAVILTEGFHAKAGISNTFIAKLGPATENSGGGPADSQAGANNPTGTTTPQGQSFHDTKGNIEVNSAGQLQFALPVALPPGVKSVAPQISLVYTNGSGNGIAGYGWNISGITSISRMGKNIEKDGDVKGIQLDYSDYYSFNGQRLILKSGEYGKNGAEYVTEKYSNIKIKSVGAVTGQPWQGPEYWEVTFEDGSQAWYGGTASRTSPARTPIEYNIVKWKDAQGNYITYIYSQLNNISIISAIRWGGNEALSKPHFNEIIFNYDKRDLRESSYVNGIQFIQDKLLNNVIVNTNNLQFKRYEITYKKQGTNYQFIDKIKERNAENSEANPIIFENELDPQATNIFKQDTRFDDMYGDNVISGDFNGDGKLDFIKGNTLMLGRLDGTGQFFNINYEGSSVCSANFTKDNTFLNRSVICTAKIDEATKILKIYIYEFSNQSMNLIFQKDYNLSAYNDLFINPNLGGITQTRKIHLNINEGDYNGDGISEFIINLKNIIYYRHPGMTYQDPPIEIEKFNGDFYVDLKKNIISFQSVKIGSKNNITGNFSGNGNTGILKIENNNINIYELNTQNQFTQKFSVGKESLDDKVYLGDFNGDGKTDIIAPIANDSSDWRMYISTGNGFKKEYYSNLFLYQPSWQGAPRKKRNIQRTYSTSDLNKDGKSDFFIFESQVWFRDGALDWNDPDSSYGFNYLRNEGVDATGKPVFSNIYNIAPKELIWDGEDLNYSMYGEHYIPLFGTFRIAQLNTEFAIIHKTKLITWDLGSKINKISRIKSTTQGGLKTEIEYSPLIETGNIYKSFYNTISVQYPFVNITENINYNVVTRLIQGERKQEFRYRDLIGNLHGKGMIGFRQTSRSTFFADGFENTKIWTGSEINPLNEGLPYKDWSIRTNDESKIFPADISLANTQLLSFKEYEYKIDQLVNGNVVATVAAIDKPRVVLAINPYITTSKDFLTGIKTIHTVESYDNLYLPKKSVTRINDGVAISTSELEYYPPDLAPGANYSIGKPKIKTEVVQAYGDTKSAKEEYTYESNLLKTLKTWNRDNTGYLQETYDHDGFGNVTQKAVSNSIDSGTQTTKTQYDTKGRFVEKKTDNLGLETTIVYNDWGQIEKQTDPLGNTLTNTYDKWGKLLTSKTNLEGTTTYQYEKDTQFNTIITQYDPDGDISKKYTNKLGQDYKASTKAFGQGQLISTETRYDVLGRKLKESEPYFDGGQGPGQFNLIDYDDSVFPAKITATAFNGKQMETSVSGSTTTVKELNGYGRTTSKTTDALGNVISSTDKGGTIQFSYNAAGEQTQAKYAENVVTTKYDSWGRKSEFNDPSNGVYKYEYDGFGQPKKITSPKGTKEYTYNALGQLVSQKEISTTDGGQATNKLISFYYDSKGRVTSKAGTSKGKAYSSNVAYDPQGRLLSSSESSNGKYFIQKGVTYDDKGRVISYEKQLYSSGILSKVQVENMYSAWNGELYQVKDKTSGKILWELEETNAKGQILKAKLGTTNVNNTYDANGFLTNVNHSSTLKHSILQLSYSFDAIRNELKSRTTGGDFNITESFDYDDNNRLINWTNPVTGIKPTTNRNVYDVKGRIMENDQVGTMKYENSAKIYQPTGMTLNAAGIQNYNNDLIQSVSYNENNDPVFIDGEKGDVAFQYGLTSMRQQVTYGGNFGSDQEGKFTKYYSENGSFEVIKDNTTGQEKHIVYVGGTPYESNIVYLKDFTESSGSYKFLHKDYLGSILAISDEAGNKLEQRHFDAWGDLAAVAFGNNGAIITDKNIIANSVFLIDRGYTSHEHFAEVGIIHMNGRLYDPLLRRFLNADENIQEPFNTQNYNKYGYVLNNPLMFNDPTGEIFGIDVIIGIGVAVIASVATDYYLNRPVNLDNMFQSVAMSLISMGVSTGIGDIFKAGGQIANALDTTGTIIAKAGAHAIAQGALSYVQGGNFWSGALAGAFASASNDLLGLAIKNVGENSILRSKGFALFNGAVSGGVGSVLGGGNFWIGAGQGLIVTAFNYLAHKETTIIEDNDSPYNGYDKNGKKINNNGGDTTDYMYDDNGNVISSTSVKITRTQGGELSSSFEGYGFRHYNQGTGGALYDASWDVASMFIGAGEVKAGYNVLKMGITKVLKSEVGIRTVFGASKYTLKSSVFFENVIGSKSINLFGLKSLPTLYGKAVTWGTFLGRNSPIIGPVIMYDGARRINNSITKTRK